MLELLALLFGVLPAAFRSQRDLVLGNLLLRHQLAVAARPRRRPRLRTWDKLVWLLGRRLCTDRRRHLVLVTPDTVVRWHRRGWRLLWSWRSRSAGGRPRLSGETRDLIRAMSRDNRLWGTERIRGELLKLGIAVSNRSIRRYRRRGPHRPSGQSWRTFLVNHRPSIWAADLLTVQTLTFRTLYVVLFVAHGRRELVHLAVTAHPTAAWVWRQLINATPWGHAPAYLVRDRDAVYGVDFARRAAGLGIRMLLTPVRAPRANAVCERFLGSVRRECIDHALILSERHLRRVLTEYVAYFNRSRPHRGIGQRTPQAAPTKVSRGRGVARDGVIAVPVLSGLHHEYRAAARPRLGWPGEPEQPDKRPASR